MSEHAPESAVATSGYLQTDRNVTPADGPIHRELQILMDELESLGHHVEVLSARLVHVSTPTDSVSAIGSVEDSKPTSPVADRLHHAVREVQRMRFRVGGLIEDLEV